MSMIEHSRFAVFLALFFIILSTSACAGEDNTSSSGGLSSILQSGMTQVENVEEPFSASEYNEGTYPIEPIFLDFYLELGGRDILGPAISAAFHDGDEIKQYVEAGLMVFVRANAQNDRFFLAPLGMGFELPETIITEQMESDPSTSVRQFIYPSFIEMYERLGGARFVGKPLTAARHNPEKGRIEQYFENLGLYTMDYDESGRVQLMAYGAYACARDCRYQPNSGAIPSSKPVLSEPFATKAVELGLQFTGRILTEDYAISEKAREVIFENLVLAANQGQSGIEAVPVVEMIGFESQSLVYRLDNPLMIFVPIEGGLGHNVPVFFMDYLNQHGGLVTSGLPLGEVYSEDDGIFWQCFENLCLEFVVEETGVDQLQPVPIGYRYKELMYDSARDFMESQSLDGIEIKTWEKSSFVSSSEDQVIHAMIDQSGSSLRNREPVLFLTMPEGNVYESYFPPTDSEGHTSLSLSPIQAPNGTLIAYQVCLMGINGQQQCSGDSYLIWQSD